MWEGEREGERRGGVESEMEGREREGVCERERERMRENLACVLHKLA